MKVLVALCLLAVGVGAQYGKSGIVSHGVQKQFTREEADNIAVIGESGVVMKDGTHVQFSRDFAKLHNGRRKRHSPQVLLKGPSGMLFEDGQQKHLGTNVEEVVSGPSGTVFSDGGNIQHRHSKRSAVVGSGGVITPDGKLIQLPHGVYVTLAGSSAAMLSNGKSIQYEH